LEIECHAFLTLLLVEELLYASGKYHMTSFEEKAGRASESVWMLWRR
jgi:hypothetical protein